MKQLIRQILREQTKHIILEMAKKLTQDEWIERASKLHKNKYDYSKVNYINSDTKVIVTCPIHGDFLVTPYHHYRNRVGCPKCSGKYKPTKDDFINRSREIHGNDYDYSQVDYKNNKTKVKIVCPLHGVFLQTPSNHTNQKQGCPKCGGSGKKSTEEFVKLAKEIHGDKFDYSEVNYINSKTPVKIICPTHGDFLQKPVVHLSSNGCPKCGWDIQNDKVRGDVDNFIKKSKELHGDTYNYSEVKYENNNTKVEIICPIHGAFMMSPNAHTNSSRPQGCPKCGGIRAGQKTRHTTDEFIEKANIVHNNKFDYSKSDYVTAYTPIKIICPKHGEFIQLPYAHLGGRGCAACNESSGERFISKLLDKKKIDYVRQKTFADCFHKSQSGRCTRLKFDFYLPNQNTCLEFDGQQHFMPVEYYGGEESFELTKKRDKIKNQYCKKNGIKLIRIPHTMKKEDIEPYILKELGL